MKTRAIAESGEDCVSGRAADGEAVFYEVDAGAEAYGSACSAG